MEKGKKKNLTHTRHWERRQTNSCCDHDGVKKRPTNSSSWGGKTEEKTKKQTKKVTALQYSVNKRGTKQRESYKTKNKNKQTKKISPQTWKHNRLRGMTSNYRFVLDFKEHFIDHFSFYRGVWSFDGMAVDE